MDRAKERALAIACAVADIRAIEAQAGVTRESLERIARDPSMRFRAFA